MGSRKAKSKCVGKPDNYKQPYNDLISLEECKEIVGTFELSDEKILELRNYIVGITNTAMNKYFEKFGAEWKENIQKL